MIIRLFKKSLKIFNIVCIYLYEYFNSIFDNRIRICFNNFGDISIDYFLYPLKKAMKNDSIYKIVKYYNPHINIFSVFGKKNNIVKSKALLKIFFTGENVNNNQYKQYEGNCIEFTNLSLGFEFLKNHNYFRYPIWLLNFFESNNTKDDIIKILYNFKSQHNKTKFCSLVARHDNNGIRTLIYNNVSKISHIDCPSKLLYNDNTLYSIYNNNKISYLQQYKFNICPENSICDGYVTEKIFHSLKSGCIPIYNGWSKDPEPGIINPEIILWYDQNDETNNINKLNEIKKLHLNEKLYNSFVSKPFFCDTAVDKIYHYLTQFNEKLINKYYETINNNYK